MENSSILISMLRQGNNGEEILEILDTIATSDDIMEPTLDHIEF
jgi:hypothetical protein